MPDEPPVQYARLPGSGVSRKGASFITVARVSCRLWLGDDHLLQVEASGGYSETYKRFYFRDIQAICLQASKSWLVANIVLGGLTGLFALWWLSAEGEAGKISLGIITGVLLLLLILNLVRGSSCTCYLKTAVHLEELPSLRRRRNAEKVLARLKPLIESAQGGLPREALAPQYDVLLAGANAVSAVPGEVMRVMDAELQPYRSRIHVVLFCALLTEAFADLLNIFLPSLPVVVLNTLVGVLLGGSVVIALVKQHQTDLKPAVRVLTWASAVYVGLGYLASYVTMIAITPARRLDGTQWGYLKALAELKPLETPALMVVLLVSAIIAGLFGAIGLLFLRDHWRSKASAA